MAIPSSPLDALTGALDKFAANLRPPDWLVDELQHRLVLFLNHVLQQEPEAMARLARSVLRGDQPGVRIEGDVQLATEVSWLVDHLRWDAEEDLSRLVGDAPAHALAEAARGIAAALRRFVPGRPGAGGDAPRS